jgi:hypothetical protein
MSSVCWRSVAGGLSEEEDERGAQLSVAAVMAMQLQAGSPVA